VKILHDAFKKAIDDPEHQKSPADSSTSSSGTSRAREYARWAPDLRQERATIERAGLLLK
jgi:hypothetical protein